MWEVIIDILEAICDTIIWWDWPFGGKDKKKGK